MEKELQQEHAPDVCIANPESNGIFPNVSIIRHGIDRADTAAAVNLLIQLGVATVEETEEQLIIIYNQQERSTEKIYTAIGDNESAGPTTSAVPQPMSQETIVIDGHESQRFADSSVSANQEIAESSTNISTNVLTPANQRLSRVPSSSSSDDALETINKPPFRHKYNKENRDISDDDINEISDLTPDTLTQLLKETVTGSNIIHQAKKGILSQRRQLELAEIVANWHLAHRTRLHERDLKKYSRVIVLLFKSENQDSYFLPRGGDKRNPGGKIANKINTLKNKARKRKLQDKEHELILNNKNVAQKEISEEANSIAQESLDWLNTNSAPWTTVLDKWKQSFPIRSTLLKKPNLLDELNKSQLWSLIKSEHGYQLFDIDFGLLDLNTEVNTSWTEHFLIIGSYIRLRSIDETSERLLSVLTSNAATDDDRACVLLLLLNTVLHPQKVTSSYKPTVVNGREDTILFANSDIEADEKVREQYKVYQQLGIPLVPKLVFFGRLSGTFRVYFQGFYYSLQSARRAIDVYIKLTAVLSLKHSKISKLVWLFIARFFYGIKVTERYASIDRLEDFVKSSITKLCLLQNENRLLC
ncbi:uncharacterized protein LOC131677980 [Topomyia yanbarensis]|uniref:uncharacterized protein LOC131677980 n=1 Tax=Topomyia yanbarensis TaxID=2498891 RepID=UPI00273B024B|nr:uncharacterized protein LOC131677980 [Topomyia yanbarensis]